MSVQKVVSTKENKELQKSSTFHSSSTVFWGILSKSEGIDTTVSFLNHFLLKRDIASVSMRLCVRRMNGDLLSEIIEEIKEPRVYSYSLESILSSVEIESGEFSIYIEFTSKGNLSVPFCAVTSEIVSKHFVDIVHTYGRALENQEIGSRIDFDTSYETGWSIWNFGENFSNNAIFHNGRIHSKLSFDLCVLKEADEIFRIEGLSYDLKPFESCRINLEHALAVADKDGKIVGIIEDAAPGDIVVKVIISGLQASFPRLLFASINHSDSSKSLKSVKCINVTHSNFDFDNANQPKSSLNYGYINNPYYPEGVKSGFRYYPCKDLLMTKLGNSELDSLPIDFESFESKKVVCDESFPSRLVGANWSCWKGSKLIKECSTGTFLGENSRGNSFWHWGRLAPKGDYFSWDISLNNPFAQDSDWNEFILNVYSGSGLICSKNIYFSGSKSSISLSDLSGIKGSGGDLWYSIVGAGIGRFHVFATTYISDLSDGTVEHSF